MNTLNVNIGILGHIDSGKTSLVKALSEILSTNALDKNPQSQQRGITLDLGFSSFQFNPTETSSLYTKYSSINCTLVDCPGHASLIKTIIGGASIIDMMLLVIDITKGIQTQTAECIVIGEILTTKLIVVLNKIDLLMNDERELKINKMTNKIKKIFSTSRFTAPLFVYTSSLTNEGIDSLLSTINDNINEPIRDNIDDPFYYLIDHCFGIKGHGTVLTGTVISGNIHVNDTVEIPNLLITKKVKSMQIFKKSVKYACQGDRVALCVSNLDPKSIERGVATSVGLCTPVFNVLCLVKQIRFYKNKCRNNTKFHVSIGHQTVLGSVSFFGHQELSKHQEGNGNVIFDYSHEYIQQDELIANNTSTVYGNEYLNWVLIQFQSPIYCLKNSVIIASKLDIDSKEYENQCRIAFYGPIKEFMSNDDVANIRMYSYKYKEGLVHKVTDTKGGLCMELIGHKLINENASLLPFIGMKIEVSDVDYRYFGYISSIYGSNTSGKFKVKFTSGIPLSYVCAGSTKLLLKYKRYTNDKSKAMIQTGIGFNDFDVRRDSTMSSNDNSMDSGAVSNMNDEMIQVLSNKVSSVDIEDSTGNDNKITSNTSQDKKELVSAMDTSKDRKELVSAMDTSKDKKELVSAMDTSKDKKELVLSAVGTSKDRKELVSAVGTSKVKEELVPPTGTSDASTRSMRENGVDNRPGIIESVKVGPDGHIAVVAHAFRMEENIKNYSGAPVHIDGAVVGELVGPYAKLGKCKVKLFSSDLVKVGDNVIILT